ncbi:MAG: hypothetical protein ABI082_01900 [Dokdonella sp.]
MTTPGWMARMAHARDDAGAQFADASDAVAAHWHETNQLLRQRGAAGLDAARDFGGDVLGGARRMSRSTRDFATERPLETALLIGVVGFAVGWLVRRMREPTPRSAAARATRSKARSK